MTKAATQEDKKSRKYMTEEIICEIKSMATEEEQQYRKKRWWNKRTMGKKAETLD